MSRNKSTEDILVRALRKCDRIATGELENVTSTDTVIASFNSIVTCARAALKKVKKPVPVLWIEQARMNFKARVGKSYRQAERFWYRETMAGRRLSEAFMTECIRQAIREEAWSLGADADPLPQNGNERVDFYE